MPVIASLISPQSETFKANAAQLLAQVEKFRGLERAVIAHSSQQAEKFAKRGQILPRERVARLLDHGTPFLELSTLAGFGMHDDDGAARVMGGGTIMGRSLLPKVASRIKTGLTADCTELEIDPDTKFLKQTRPAFGGNIMATILCQNHRPQMATVRHKVMKAAAKVGKGTGIIVDMNHINVPERTYEILEFSL